MEKKKVYVKVEQTVKVKGEEHPVSFSAWVDEDKQDVFRTKVTNAIKEWEKKANKAKKLSLMSRIVFPFVGGAGGEKAK